MKIQHRLFAACTLLWCTLLSAATATIPTVSISSTPLYGQSQNIHPNLMMTLSVEFPTTGAAYRGTYDKSQPYLGYFNNTKCYTYDATNGYFKISGDANSAHECSSAFSGNFMNWASASAIDELRLAMTGGDRVIDTRTQTVLQRALLRSDFFKSGSYFPLKSINGSGTTSAPNKVTPFSYGTLYMASCGNHIFFSDADDSRASCSSPGKYADVTRNGAVTERRGFRVQVQVCDSSEATTRTDLCFSYDGTNYKPVGQMQRNAERVRFAAFGYLNDPTNNTSNSQNERFGGVLRAPMKYLGDNAVNASLNTITNPAKEWDSYGVLVANPLNDASGNSGVINYLNKFGRTLVTDLGKPTDNPAGNYKQYDPLGELYYESIRYLQNHPDGPTPSAVNGVTTAYADNFAYYTSWTDPLLNSCQRNYVLTIGDINTHQDHYIPGNAIANQGDPARATDSWSKFNVVEWTNKVGALETNTPAAGNANPLDSSYTNLGTKNHATSNWSTYYMAGIAYWAHTSSFRPTMPEARVTTFGIDVNENGNGMVGPTQRQSQIYLAAKYGGFKEETADGGNKDGNPFKTLGSGGVVVTNNSEWEAAPTGSNIPSNWFLASQPAQMIGAIKQIFTQITSSAGTLSGVALSSTRLIDNGNVYTPGFDQQWNGKLTAYAMTKGTDGSVSISSTPSWEAGTKLTTRAFSTRSIYTLNPASGAGTAFAWANLAKTQQDLLNLNPGIGTSDGRGQLRVDYLRGDRSQEADSQGSNGGMFRGRKTVFGDIINSGPVYVGAPSSSRSGTDYSTFFTKYLLRTPMVYVGANDGMLHGFNANTGDEVFAYVPNAVFDNLNQLTSTTYNHRAYVDATPVVAEAQVNGNWKSVLAGGFGGGAQGIYALDVTDPAGTKSGAAFNASNVLWEFTDKDDADMGNVMGTPVIVKLLSGYDSNKQPVYKWYVVVGNGLNANQADGYANTSAPGVLFILSLDKAAGATWSLNGNYWKIVTPSPSTTALANGLSTPALVNQASGAALALYAGDLQGNLWKFNVSGLPETWNASGALPAFGGTPGKPMFVATSPGNGPRQPITMQPQVVYAPGGFMVLFGTGKYYELADTNSTASQINSFYGIYDGGGTNYVSDRTKLNQQSLSLIDGGKSIQYTGSAAAPGYTSPRKPGWVMDFLEASERQITDAVVSNGLVYFNSIYTATGTCGTSGGSRSYALNTLTGTPTTGVSGYQSSTGMLGAPSIIVTNVTVGDRDSVGGLQQTTRTQVISFGTSGAAITMPATDSQSRPGRMSWREIRNFKIAN